MHIRKTGERDSGHRVDFAFTGDVDASAIIQMTLDGVEVAMSMREWHALAVQSASSATEKP